MLLKPKERLVFQATQENPYKGIDPETGQKISRDPNDVASPHIFAGRFLELNSDLIFCPGTLQSEAKVLLKPFYAALDHSPTFRALCASTSVDKYSATGLDGRKKNLNDVAIDLGRNLGAQSYSMDIVKAAFFSRLGLELAFPIVANPDYVTAQPIFALRNANVELFFTGDKQKEVYGDLSQAKQESLKLVPFLMKTVEKTNAPDPDIYQKIIKQLTGENTAIADPLAAKIISDAKQALSQAQEPQDGWRGVNRLIDTITKVIARQEGEKSAQELARSLFVACMADQKRQVIERRITDSEK